MEQTARIYTTPAFDRLDAFGIDAVCEAIADGASMTSIAADVGVGFGSLSNWLAADVERSARAVSARKITAQYWEEKAEAGLSEAPDPFELSRAKELASHYRWRASKIAPREYGDKLQHANAAGDGDQVTKVEYSWATAPQDGEA